ncbi:hypothetical protein Anapl_12071 [Anas platyrhynchos]|uniref:Uncharacterized protein n=1 Tax=Anas platyrhynchos TaxID=8839 RepID=R0L2L1_ANAPL|nr:hypothetical protein Anapl_12071 [Anas platyrhynchos]
MPCTSGIWAMTLNLRQQEKQNKSKVGKSSSRDQQYGVRISDAEKGKGRLSLMDLEEKVIAVICGQDRLNALKDSEDYEGQGVNEATGQVHCLPMTVICVAHDWLKALICQMYALSLRIYPIKPIDQLRVSSYIASQGLHKIKRQYYAPEQTTLLKDPTDFSRMLLQGKLYRSSLKVTLDTDQCSRREILNLIKKNAHLTEEQQCKSLPKDIRMYIFNDVQALRTCSASPLVDCPKEPPPLCAPSSSNGCIPKEPRNTFNELCMHRQNNEVFIAEGWWRTLPDLNAVVAASSRNRKGMM